MSDVEPDDATQKPSVLRFLRRKFYAVREWPVALGVYCAICGLLAIPLAILYESDVKTQWGALFFGPLLQPLRWARESFFQPFQSVWPKGWGEALNWLFIYPYLLAIFLPMFFLIWKGKRARLLLLQAAAVLVVWLVGAVLFVREHQYLPSASDRLNVRLWVLCRAEVRAANLPTLSDSDMAYVAKLSSLVGLGLRGSHVTDIGLVHLKTLTQLEELSLANTRVSDEGLAHLKSLTQLQSLWLNNTRVTKQGVEELRKALPSCQITWDGK